MPRKHYNARRRQQASKRARVARKEAAFAGLPSWTGHPSHISFRWTRMGNRAFSKYVGRIPRRFKLRTP